MMPFIHGIRVVVCGLLLLAVAKVANLEPSTAAVEQKSQQTGDRPGIAEAPAAVVGPPVPGKAVK